MRGRGPAFGGSGAGEGVGARGAGFHKATSHHRRKFREGQLNDGVDLQTIFYRAPEVLFGDQDYGAAIDCWSAGLVLAELAGCRFHRSAASLAQATSLARAKMLCRFFGLPPVTNLRTKPQKLDAAQGTPQWPPATLASLGQTGRHLLDGCLTWSASARWCARATLDSPFLTPERFVATAARTQTRAHTHTHP